jgi:hypothetical protein
MRKYWTDREIARLRRLYPDSDNGVVGKALGRSWSAVQNMAVKLGLKKSEAFMRSPVCRFQKGMVPWNLGKTGYMGANVRSFRKGNMPQTWRPVGSERIDDDGILLVKVSDTRNKNRDWVPFHRLVWESWFGRVPNGRIVVFADRNQRNTDISNLLCVTRAENMLRNSYHRYPQPIPQLIQLRGAINRQINKRAA